MGHRPGKIHVYLDSSEENCYGERWKNRRESGIVKMLMGIAKFERSEMAARLGINSKNFDAKMFRNSWSFKDIEKVARHCGYTVLLVDSGLLESTDCDISPEEVYFDGCSAGYEKARRDFIEAIQDCQMD